MAQGGGKGGVTARRPPLVAKSRLAKVSLLEDWVKFRTDEATADQAGPSSRAPTAPQVQNVRGALQAAFQSFCPETQRLSPSRLVLRCQAG